MQTTEPFCPICSARSKYAFTKDEYSLYACASCRFSFVYPTPSEDVLKDIYSESYFKNNGTGAGYTDYDKDKEPMRTVFQLYLSKLEKLIAHRNLFDVGAATGYFLDMAKQRGWRTFGSEISDYGRKEAESRGHRMVGELSSCEEYGNIHVVTLWDVLEHVDNPRAYLKKVYTLLSPKGIVAINTIDISSMWARVLGKRWHLIVPPEHLNYFSKNSIKILLEQEGFEVLEIKKIGKSFSLPYICKTLYAWQGLGLWLWLTALSNKTVLRTVAIPINLYDNMFVIARKRI